MEPLRRSDPLPLTSRPPWRALFRGVSGISWRAFEAGEVVRPGGLLDGRVGVVVEGVMGLFVTGCEGRRACVAVLGAGDVFAMDPAGPARPDEARNRTSIEAGALVPCRIASVPAAELLFSLAGEPALAGWLIGALAQATQTLQRRLAQALSLPVGGRILAALQDLARARGCAVPNGTRVELPLTQEQLAELVGATRETVNRAIRSLERDGRLRRVAGRYVVPSSPAPLTAR